MDLTRTSASSNRTNNPTTTMDVVTKEHRKRKRGALQDISNSATNKKLPPASNASAVVKKTFTRTKIVTTRGTASTAGVSRATGTRTTKAGGVFSSTAAAAGKRTNTTTLKKTTDLAAKKRKQDGDEKVLHQKVQTSLLSFQSKPATAKSSSSGATNASIGQTETKKTTDAKKDGTPVKKSKFDEHPLPMEPVDEKEVKGAAKPAIPQVEQEPDIYRPRPYLFTFDHTDSGFDEQTYTSSIRDIDDPKINLPTHCAKLVRELDIYYRKHEEKYLPEATYIGTLQTDINEKMRTILVDWLVEVGEEYELDSQTFHKAVNLVDRYLAKFKINRKQFQLLGCACMMIAAKFEEVYGPNVEEFVYISDQTYTAEEMLEMEAKVLHTLEYRIASTTCHGFLPRFLKAGCTTDKQRSLVMYLCDFAMLYYHMLKYRPSQIAASAVYLARLMTDEKEPWTPTLHHFTQYNAWDLQSCILELYRLHRVEAQVVETQRDKAKAVSEKYFAEKYHSASTIPPVDEAKLEKSFFLFDPRRSTSTSTSAPRSA